MIEPSFQENYNNEKRDCYAQNPPIGPPGRYLSQFHHSRGELLLKSFQPRSSFRCLAHKSKS